MLGTGSLEEISEQAQQEDDGSLFDETKAGAHGRREVGAGRTGWGLLKVWQVC